MQLSAAKREIAASSEAARVRFPPLSIRPDDICFPYSSGEDERQRKRSGATDQGSTGMTRAMLEADYRLSGRIESLDSRNVQTGMVQRHMQIAFELTDLKTGALIWTGIYEFSRAATDDVIYR